MRASFAIASAAVLAAACGAPRSATTALTPDGERAAREAIATASREFSARYERGDAQGMVALYTGDGVILPPGLTALRGPAALLEYWTLAPGVKVLEHRVTADTVVVLGSVAYDWGTYRVRTRNANGQEGGTVGKYVIVWREVAPGDWRIHVDMWNSGPAAGPASQASAAIFRYVEVEGGRILLGEPLPAALAAAFGAAAGDTIVPLPRGSFGGAERITLHLTRTGVVRGAVFDYLLGADFERMLASYSSLGAPERTQRRRAGEEPADVATWQDARTVFRLVRDPNRSAWTVRSELWDRSLAR